jgi:gas vesicle protein
VPSPVGQYRRHEDPPSEDYTRLRGRRPRNGLDTLTKWIVGVVATAIVGSSAYLLVRDRLSIDVARGELSQRVDVTSALAANHEVQIQLIRQRQDRVLADLSAIQKDIDDIQKTTLLNAETLAKVLNEVKKK